MEDRHYLSEPRPISGLKLPTWEVDVMREGVDVPILTLEVDSHVLPPRKRKKKVVWKLPDDLETIPKFGMEDKRRILELFKQKKKELKRQRKTQTTGSGNEEDGHNSPGSSNGNSKILHRMSSSAMSVGSYTTANEEHPEDDPGEEKEECSEGGEEEEEEKVEDTNVSSSAPPPGFNMSGVSLDDDDDYPTPHRVDVVRQQPQLPRPPPPPSMQPLQERAHSFAGSRGPPLSTSTSTPPPVPPPPPGLNFSSTATTRRASTSSIPPPGMNHPFPTSIGMARHFIVADPSALGHVVMETYYLLLRSNKIQDLALYYTPGAQKSLTVGGAHALCADANQRIQQLESLTKMVLQVKGVLQHPSIDKNNNNIYVMITGTTLQPQCLPFCHSLCLKQVGPQAFQIQNDALAFLTTEG